MEEYCEGSGCLESDYDIIALATHGRSACGGWRWGVWPNWSWAGAHIHSPLCDRRMTRRSMRWRKRSQRREPQQS